jgi:NADPH:quinone reductase-like Zn-dependent oxidoreductase
VQNVEVPKILGPKQLLVKIKAAPINPSDIGFSLGNYAIKHELPTIVGLEGAGQVVQVGE